jgi:hypothetical protein
MKALADIGKREITQEAARLLRAVFADAKEKLDDYPYRELSVNGNVVLDGSTFTYADRALRMLGYCPVCGMEVISTPIRKFADIGDQLSSFKPGRHSCMDV